MATLSGKGTVTPCTTSGNMLVSIDHYNERRKPGFPRFIGFASVMVEYLRRMHVFRSGCTYIDLWEHHKTNLWKNSTGLSMNHEVDHEVWFIVAVNAKCSRLLWYCVSVAARPFLKLEKKRELSSSGAAPTTLSKSIRLYRS